jgi:hypothetical protein|nr:MAG TPA: hypothetical protein [Caudoviricetes sp.]
MMIDSTKLMFGGSDWSVRRRARLLDQMDQYIKAHINSYDDSSIREWRIFGILDKSDEEVLEMAEDYTQFINALFVFQGIVAGESIDEILTVKIGRFN